MNSTDKFEDSYGAKMVGLTFNPSNNPYVDEIKTFSAQMINRLMLSNQGSTMKTEITSKAIKDIMTAQMWAVKALTWVD